MISALKGLSGQFSTIFQVDTMQFARYHYSTIENRTLQRYRMNLSREQKKTNA